MKTFQIRRCINPTCGLRYPLIGGQSDGIRCPVCLGETIEIINKHLREEAQVQGIRQDMGLSVVLDNIRSANNVGSILRTADGLGFSHAYLCGITASPESAQLQKTSLGAEQMVSWSLHPDGLRLINMLKEENFYILALETGEKSMNLDKWQIPRSLESRIILVLGGETTGIDPGIIEAANMLVCLPMYGRKRSLNVAVAFGIAAHQLSLRMQSTPSSPVIIYEDKKAHR
jgi:tRNA G18 (ribose-2'-O)-methylase SpoU